MPVTNVKTKWSGGDLYFYDKNENEIFHVDGTNRKVVFPAASGIDLPLQVDATDIAAGAATPDKLGLAVINKTGVSIAADKLVAVSSLDVTSGKPKIVLADADVAAHEDVWVTTAAIADNAQGTVVKNALSAATLNTNSVTTAGDPVYLDVTAGGFAVTAPTGATARSHPVGMVVVKSATVGQIRWNIGPVRKIGTNEVQLLAITTALLAAGVISADAAGRALLAAGVFDVATVDSAFATGSIGEDRLTANELTGRAVANGANANVIGALPVIHRVDITAGALGDTDVVLTHKTRVVDAWLILRGAGVATTTLTVKNGANAITNAMAASGSDTDLVRAAQINDDNHEIAAGGTLRVTSLTGATQPDATVYVSGVRVA